MTLKSRLAADGEGHRNAADRDETPVATENFVINLCSSTTPMALAQPDTPELKRFKFFVSRRLEDGRERFRLHMGHFETLEEAEDWLSVVREIYPGAWAGEMPGKRLRARAPAMPQTAPVAMSPESKDAPPEESVLNRASQPPLPSAPPPNAAAAAPILTKQPPPVPNVERRLDAAAAAASSHVQAVAATPLSNVREVLAALDERDTSRTVPTLTARPALDAARPAQTLSDTQVMQMLEARRTGEPGSSHTEAVPRGIPMLRPDDSGTRRALKDAVQDNAAVSFAVQLQWSVQPMVLDKVPPLAIFSAYTLYTVEGSREGRKWYGLRLGFFSDAIAAKQVAHYVRSDFASVAVVPVSAQERGRASSAEHTSSAVAVAEISPAPNPEEIKLFDEKDLAAPRTPQSTSGVKTGSSAARAAATRSKQLRSKEHAPRKEHSLEETLEILGAGSLEIDNGRGELINESGVRHLKVEERKNSPFQRLVARLTERVRKS